MMLKLLHRIFTRRQLLAILLMLSVLPVAAQQVPTSCAGNVALRTNMLYDVVVAPNVGVEVGLARKWSVALSGTYGWMEGSPWYDNIRGVVGDAEVRYWLSDDAMHRGLHVGAYGAIYRYDFLFNGKGEQAKANWGGGLSLGYTLKIDRQFSVDFSIGVGYVGGKFKSYEVSNDELRHNVWTADKIRHFFGPTKAEISLVWNIGNLFKKGGRR